MEAVPNSICSVPKHQLKWWSLSKDYACLGQLMLLKYFSSILDLNSLTQTNFRMAACEEKVWRQQELNPGPQDFKPTMPPHSPPSEIIVIYTFYWNYYPSRLLAKINLISQVRLARAYIFYQILSKRTSLLDLYKIRRIRYSKNVSVTEITIFVQ